MVLVDTSLWIEVLRERGDAQARQRVTELVEEGEAAWCDAVKLELWNGRAGEAERKMFERLDKVVTTLPINDHVWALSHELAAKARAKGLSAPAFDVLIAACGAHHNVPVDSRDKHFHDLATLG